jgi:hypothetical protein
MEKHVIMGRQNGYPNPKLTMTTKNQFQIWIAKSKTDYDYKNPDSDLDTIRIWMPLNPI